MLSLMQEATTAVTHHPNVSRSFLISASISSERAVSTGLQVIAPLLIEVARFDRVDAAVHSRMREAETEHSQLL